MARLVNTATWRTLPGYLVVFTLSLLLVSTTPVGTGAGVHQFDLVHPLFSHVHLLNGRILTHQQMEQDQSAASGKNGRALPGPSIGAGSAPVQADAGLGLSPTLPAALIGLPAASGQSPLVFDSRVPTGRLEAPPDPPPTSAT